MAEGANAVKRELMREFGVIQIQEGRDKSTHEVLLTFVADKGLTYKVRVSREYDDDYASGQIKLDIRGLGKTLRSSTSGLVRVTRTGIIAA
jgi:hypothetical protein